LLLILPVFQECGDYLEGICYEKGEAGLILKP